MFPTGQYEDTFVRSDPQPWDPTPPAEPTQTRLIFESKGAGWDTCTCVGRVDSCSPYVHAHDYGAYNLGRKKFERDEFESKGKV
ncbi:uncharacterized protein EAE97_000804 [Botrytis byssoidea]|uniref:Uncharacterized protein n=1 Tax=Botrytis byssoidea TaxID=139641 RepID=A0A9P5IVM9_9HELO|nr:uncharacterized protein EAE97_000804 [Botrytis byssoidea]KAF7953405.1 hypothetical protein EAE97_000804 [Botrytis byssoidea]